MKKYEKSHKLAGKLVSRKKRWKWRVLVVLSQNLFYYVNYHLCNFFSDLSNFSFLSFILFANRHHHHLICKTIIFLLWFSPLPHHFSIFFPLGVFFLRKFCSFWLPSKQILLGKSKIFSFFFISTLFSDLTLMF